MTVKPLTRTRSINIPWRSFLNWREPDLEREKRKQLEYEFSNNRQFHADPSKRGAYAPEEE